MLVHGHITAQKPRRAIIIGSGGFVGSTILKEFGNAGIAAVGLTRREIDLLSPFAGEKLKGLLDPRDSVVFVSALAPAKTNAQLLDNLRMAQAAATAIAAVKPAHLLYISSDAVYADDANPVNERSLVAPTTIHGVMHAARELMFRTEHKGPFAVLRSTLIYGAADPHSGYGPNRFRRQAMKGEAISIFGEGEERRDHIAVEDVARLAVRIAQHASTGVLNAATGVSVSFNKIAHIVAAQFSPDARVVSAPRPGPQPHLLHRYFEITACYKSFADFRFEALQQGLARVHRETSGAA